jgi:hypothetical protein
MRDTAPTARRALLTSGVDRAAPAPRALNRKGPAMAAHRRTRPRRPLRVGSATALAFGVVASLAPAAQASAAQAPTAKTATATAKATAGHTPETRGEAGQTAPAKTSKSKTSNSKATKSTATKSTATTTNSTTQTSASPSPPAPQAAVEGDGSYYVTSSDPQLLLDTGCQDGSADASSGAPERLTILDFGGQYADGSGTKPVAGPAELTNTGVEELAENYALGWYLCTDTDRSAVLTLGVGTNNSLADVTTAGGVAWAKVVATVAAAEATVTNRVVVDGADDIETEFSAPAAALDWAAGYSAAGTGGYYLDYGDAGGCPKTTWDNGACNNGWNQYDVWQVSWGEPAALPVPEIYYPGNAAQWAQISRYGTTGLDGPAIDFAGDLSEYAADPTTLNPVQSWAALAATLNTPPATTQTSLTDIRYETR